MRVLVTRPEPAAAATAGRLAALGHRPLVAPVTLIRPIDGPPPEGHADALILTSANAIPALDRLADPRGLPVFVVGRRTAERLGALGHDAVAWREDAAGLAQAVAAALPAGAALIHVAGRNRKAEPAATLAAAGFALTVWEVYAAEALDRLPHEVAAALDARRLDAALHVSRRSAAILYGLVARSGRETAFRGLRHLCLSADVAAALSDLGEARIEVAARPDEASLLARLDAP